MFDVKCPKLTSFFAPSLKFYRTPKSMSTIIPGAIDIETRCSHYSSPLDIIAIKFKCCNQFYPCYKCHPLTHDIARFDRSSEIRMILCGVCRKELTFTEYSSKLQCLNCNAKFNPGCKAHYDIYFS